MTERSSSGRDAALVERSPEPVHPIRRGDEDEEWQPDFSGGLVRLSVLFAAVKGKALLCSAAGLAGLVLGLAMNVTHPAPYQAGISLFLTYSPYENDMSAPSDNLAISRTRAVAEIAAENMGIPDDASSVLSSYVASLASNRVVVITYSAPSPRVALEGARAVAAGFLAFRAKQLERHQEELEASLEQRLGQLQRDLGDAEARLKQATPDGGTRDSSTVQDLSADVTTTTRSRDAVQQAIDSNNSNVRPANAAAVQESQVLDGAALLARGHLKRLLLYPLTGFILGAAAAIASVVVRAASSDCLTRRRDIAAALGAPVTTSAGRLGHAGRPRSPRMKREIGRVASTWERALTRTGPEPTSLVVVAVDDAPAAALPLAALARSVAGRGQRVVVADLAAGAPAARLLGAARAGVKVVNAEGSRIVVAALGGDRGLAPAGPFATPGVPTDDTSGFSEAVADACAHADLLLTLVTLDPSSPCDHLVTWGTDVIAVITAGRSSWTRIEASGEMIRASGARLVSTTVLAADRRDETLGTHPARPASFSEATPQARNEDVDWKMFTAEDNKRDASRHLIGDVRQPQGHPG